MKNTHGGVLHLVKVTLLHGCFLRFLNCTNGTKSRKTSHILLFITPMEVILVCERYFLELVIVKVKDKKKYSIKDKIYNVNKIWFQALYGEVMLVLLQIVITF